MNHADAESCAALDRRKLCHHVLRSLEHVELTPFRIISSYGSLPSAGDNQTTFTFGFFTQGNDTADFSQGLPALSTTYFEQVQCAATTGDVLVRRIP